MATFWSIIIWLVYHTTFIKSETLSCSGSSCGPCNSGPCTLDCTGSYQCSNTKLYCLDGEDCIINCYHSGGDACSFAKVYGGSASSIALNCGGANGQYDCGYLAFYAQNAIDVTINCDISDSCSAAEITCGIGTCTLSCLNQNNVCEPITVDTTPATTYSCVGVGCGPAPAPVVNNPSPIPSPTSLPTYHPSVQPTRQPSSQPTHIPSVQPSQQPSPQPSVFPTSQPTTMVPITLNPSIQSTIYTQSTSTSVPTTLNTNVITTLDPTINPSDTSDTSTIIPSLIYTLSTFATTNNEKRVTETEFVYHQATEERDSINYVTGGLIKIILLTVFGVIIICCITGILCYFKKKKKKARMEYIEKAIVKSKSTNTNIVNIGATLGREDTGTASSRENGSDIQRDNNINDDIVTDINNSQIYGEQNHNDNIESLHMTKGYIHDNDAVISTDIELPIINNLYPKRNSFVIVGDDELNDDAATPITPGGNAVNINKGNMLNNDNEGIACTRQ